MKQLVTHNENKCGYSDANNWYGDQNNSHHNTEFVAEKVIVWILSEQNEIHGMVISAY